MKRIAVLSGKGGTGKTLLSVNLAYCSGHSVYVDCDVEEPNGNLFFKPEITRRQDVCVKIPQIDEEKCISCRKCSDFCRFNALAFVKKKPFVFDEICHSCGGCSLVCPVNAISEREHVIGRAYFGNSGDVKVMSGELNEGEASGIPIINTLLNEINPDDDADAFVDCPPGSACIVMDSIKDADYCVLAAEPTVFGAHNLNMVYKLVKLFGKPHGVVLNKCLDGFNPSKQFCDDNGIKIIGRIPFDSRLGEMNSRGLIVSKEDKTYNGMFRRILETIRQEAGI